MRVKYEKHILKLWKLAGEIGTEAESDPRYEEVYTKLAEALDKAESENLVQYKEEE